MVLGFSVVAAAIIARAANGCDDMMSTLNDDLAFARRQVFVPLCLDDAAAAADDVAARRHLPSLRRVSRAHCYPML